MAPDTADEAQNAGGNLSCERTLYGRQALQAPGSANTEALAHDKPEDEGGGVNEQPFSDVLLPAKVDAAHQYSMNTSTMKSLWESSLTLLESRLRPSILATSSVPS